jgi:hypothetical protein
MKLKQEKLQQVGNTLALFGTVVVVVIPRLIGIRYTITSRAQIFYFILTLTGVCLTLLGSRFATIAYKTEGETPKWIKKIMSFWN